MFFWESVATMSELSPEKKYFLELTCNFILNIGCTFSVVFLGRQCQLAVDLQFSNRMNRAITFDVEQFHSRFTYWKCIRKRLQKKFIYCKIQCPFYRKHHQRFCMSTFFNPSIRRTNLVKDQKANKDQQPSTTWLINCIFKKKHMSSTST